MRRSWVHAAAVEPDLVEALSKASSKCEAIWRQARHQNWIITKSAYMEDCHNEFKRATNPLQVFIEEECVVEANAKVSSKVLRKYYIQFCEENGYKELTANNLGKELKRFGINKTRIRTEEGRIIIYEGIQLLSGSVHSVHSVSIV